NWAWAPPEKEYARFIQRRIRCEFSTESDAVGAGQFVPESVVSLPWNPWSVSHGIGGQFPPESVVSLDRNTHQYH
ncbi:hypothetical protein, partial [Desulfomicrobium norvegicum]|uniref:hypothetical protein n=1 Tax=Desulfomicrobium norvegicum (strain DSM 1741 / NCIMB 8310) TaxID=52561 RepID=UPI001ABF42FA